MDLAELPGALRAVAAWAAALPAGELAVADFYARADGAAGPPSSPSGSAALLAGVALPPACTGSSSPRGARRRRALSAMTSFTFRPGDGGLVEDELLRGLHPMMSHRLQLARLSEFALDRLPAAEDVYLFHGVARTNPKDERLFALAEVRDLTPVRDADGRVAALPELERMLVQALEGIRRFQAHRKPSRRLQWNRVLLHVWPAIDLTPEEIRAIGAAWRRRRPAWASRWCSSAAGCASRRHRARARAAPLRAGGRRASSSRSTIRRASRCSRSTRARSGSSRRGGAGLLHPAEIVKLLAPAGERAAGARTAGRRVRRARPRRATAGSCRSTARRRPTRRGSSSGCCATSPSATPRAWTRVALLGDPTHALGSLAEPECRRIIAALDLAEELGVPLEWFALSAGARIAMDSGTENMDWIAAVLRRIIEFTQAGGEINVVVAGINVGAQPYWNAEATMLMHTRGILVMTPESAMVLTGKQSLDYSGGVSAEDNFGIGGYDRIMGPNGQAQYWAPDLAAACRILLDYYEHAYVAPGERFPRRARTTDPVDRDVRVAPHAAPGSDLARVGDVFSDAANPGRKKPFDIRSVMGAVIDADHPPLERWAGMRDAEVAVVWDAHLGGWPVAMIGIESHALCRATA